MVLNNDEISLLRKVRAANDRLAVFENDPDFERLNQLWERDYLIRAVSWFEKDYIFRLTHKADDII